MITVRAFLEAFAQKGASGLNQEIEECYPVCTLWTAKQVYSSASKHSRDWEQALEKAHSIFSDALIILFENARAQKIKPRNARLSTYLIAICKNLLRNEKPGFLTLPPIDLSDNDTAGEEESKTQLLEKLQECMEKLDARRQALVKGFNDGKSHRELADELEYKNEDVAKATYHQCLKQLYVCMDSIFNHFN